MKEKIRILHITATLDMGGIENFLINVYRKIDRNIFQFDFVINDRGKKDIFEKEIEQLGGKIYKIPSIVDSGHFLYLENLKKIFESNKYQIVHSHYNMISGFILKEAKKSNIRIRIAHSHSTNDINLRKINLKNIYKRYSRYLISKYATERFACSTEAGKWLFRKSEFEIINNAIDIEKFIFNKEKRVKIRKLWNIEKDKFAIVNIARMSLVKNHLFLLELMKELEKIDKNIVLYLIGDGELRGEIEKKIQEYNLKNVFLLGIHQNINEILNGMDLMLFPSLYEGLGIVAVEAQVNGLMVLGSNNIPIEADLGVKLFKTLNLNDNIKVWIDEIIKYKKTFTRYQTEQDKIILLKSNYNIKNVVKILENKYMDYLNKK